jgi:hypothetical protein
MLRRVIPTNIQKSKSAGGGSVAWFLQELAGAVSALTCVREITSFGSFATGTEDEWSDLDLLVACVEPEKTAWRAAGAIRAFKPVAYYRMFTGVPQPSGRYWFENESPFLRLDISFHSTADHAIIVKTGVRADHPIRTRSEYCAQSKPDLVSDELIYPPARALHIKESEIDVGRLLYIHLEALKYAMRNRPWKRDPAMTRAELLAAMVSLPAAVGGDLRTFVSRVCEITQSR